jgi:hypothetical protein
MSSWINSPRLLRNGHRKEMCGLRRLQRLARRAPEGYQLKVMNEQTHAEQLRHVQKGCLERICDGISSDGSRIEGSHKGWNSIQRSFASGIEVFCALAHDFVLRRNIRIGSAQEPAAHFIKSAFGSHHIHLVSYVANMWNSLLSDKKRPTAGLLPLPELQIVASEETFGLVSSRHIETFGGLLEIKDEDEDNLLDAILTPTRPWTDINIDPSLVGTIDATAIGFSPNIESASGARDCVTAVEAIVC